MSATTDILFTGLEEELLTLARGASGELRLIAPFMKVPQLRAVLQGTPLGVKVRVTTRWRPDEVALGVSDLGVFDLCEDHGAELRLLDRLHAKIFLADGTRMLVGSANLTARGLGAATPSNFEVLLPCTPSRRSTAMMLAAIDAESRPATAEEKAAVARSAEEFAAIPHTPPGLAGPGAPPPWLPSFRSPDRLHGIYVDLSDDVGIDTDETAMRDMAVLGLPFGLDRRGFHSAVRTRLAAQAPLRSLDELLSRPRRFGEVSAWIGSLRPEATHAERQRIGQTLVRWLLHFAPDRYRIDTPNHSEILSLKAGMRSGDPKGGAFGET